MKLMISNTIDYECFKQNCKPDDIYKLLLSGEEIEFDLLNNGDQKKFVFTRNMMIYTRDKFTRSLSF